MKLISAGLPALAGGASIDVARLIQITKRTCKPLDPTAYDSDKIELGYLELYEPFFAPLTSHAIQLLELGVKKGESLKLWRDYFPRGRIVGIDRRLPRGLALGERIQVFKGDQADTEFLSKVANATAPDGFDVIIDDASHIGQLTKTTFWHLFDHHLKPGGLYAIEDWGTGYLDDFRDGRRFKPNPYILHRVQSFLSRRLKAKIKIPFPCHAYGMVGFIKELVDEQGAGSISLGRKSQFRFSKFKNLLITHGIVFVTKAKNILSASPYFVPTGDGTGKTTISWNSVEGKIYVSADGAHEALFSASPRGSQDADWIRSGSRYEFRLYDGAHTELLEKIVVTGAKR